MKRKKLVFTGAMAAILTSSAIAAGSVRIGGGSMRAGSLKTIPEYEQSVSTTDTARMALSKSSSNLNKKLSDIVKVKEAQSSKQQFTTSDIRDLESRMTSRMDSLETAISNINGELADVVEEIQKLSAGVVVVKCPEGCHMVASSITEGEITVIRCVDNDGKQCKEQVIQIETPEDQH